jgi:hypothetical protein
VKSDQAENKDAAPSGTISEATLRDAPNVNERFESSLPLIPGVVGGPDGRVNLKGTRNTQSGALVAEPADAATRCCKQLTDAASLISATYAIFYNGATTP